MAEKLVTIAEYLEPVEADMMRNRLEEEGIRAMLDNIGVVSMVWMFSQAVGGIKLMVFEEDAERALEILEGMRAELEEARRETAAQMVAMEGEESEQEDEFAEQEEELQEDEGEAQIASDENPWRAPRGLESSHVDANQKASANRDEDLDNYPILNDREKLAVKTMYASILGYLFCPIQFYATYLIVRVLMDPSPLPPKVNTKLNWAIGLTGFYWFCCCILWWLMMSG